MSDLVDDDPDLCLVAGHAIPRGAEGRTALLLARIGTVLTDLADERLAAAGLDGREYSILAILATDGPGSQQDLATLLGRAPGVIVAKVDGLEERGLVVRTRDPGDRRRSRVTLTPAGAKALTAADEVAEQTVREVLGGLDAAQRRQLDELIAVGVGLRPAA
ncbi:MarR family winged helix-turn-helix transcriptional regulator [Baekduia alba]|uniref:MarR family winged helix-turn-helix transcriptional regulator n=1 Tax=Baekduia alba TaxID=2997333 RepID=UPI0023402665|nr:MarR family transcriptional regulator [Baekduia alba]